MDTLQKNPTIITENLTTGYEAHGVQKVISSCLNESLYPGQLTCLLGPNGAGKSTLLRTMARFQQPLSGRITIEGRDMNDYSGSELARKIGIVLTERVELQNFSVEQLVSLGRSPYTGFWGSVGRNDRKVVEEALASVGITRLAQRLIGSLSDGERQKAMIAKVLAQQTPVIFLDEPTAFLDFPSKVEIMELLKELSHRHGTTVFISTHDLEIALQTADSLWLIDKEKGIATGTPEKLAANGDLARYFERGNLKFLADEMRFHIEGGNRVINGCSPSARH